MPHCSVPVPASLVVGARPAAPAFLAGDLRRDPILAADISLPAVGSLAGVPNRRRCSFLAASLFAFRTGSIAACTSFWMISLSARRVGASPAVKALWDALGEGLYNGARGLGGRVRGQTARCVGCGVVLGAGVAVTVLPRVGDNKSTCVCG